MPHQIRLAAFTLAALIGYADGASAQLGGMQSNRIQPSVGKAPREAPRAAPPPALPGSRAEPTAVAPADRPAADLPPTEALFDAINRGDITTARDAISRGADLSGRNVLGLSPLELAVDLGRNDISFLLLSLRAPGGDGGPSGPPPSRADAAASRQARAQALAEQRAQERSQERDRRRMANMQPASANSAQGPRLFARDGGAPNPDAGFLGFDPAR